MPDPFTANEQEPGSRGLVQAMKGCVAATTAA